VYTGLKDLLRELQEVTEWQPFGRHLGLEEPELEAIYEDNQTTEDSRREMIMLWMERDPECSWQKIVNALVQMEALPLAAQIARRYGNLLHATKLRTNVDLFEHTLVGLWQHTTHRKVSELM